MGKTKKKAKELQSEIMELRNLLVELDYEKTKRLKTEEALRESLENFRALAENAKDGIIIVSNDGECIFANKAASDITGYTNHQLLNKTLRDLVDPKEIKSIMQRYQKRITGIDIDPTSETIAVGADGIRFPIEITASRTIWQGKSSTIGIFRDISERKRVEEALRESEEKFRNLAEKSPNMIFIHNFKSLVYVNDECIQQMGYTKDEFYSKDFDYYVLITPDSKELVQKAFKSHIEGLDIPPYEYSIITKNGRQIDTIITTKLIKFEGENAILGIITDISNLKKMERILKDNAAQLRITLDFMPEAIHVVDRNLKIVMINKSFIDWTAELDLNKAVEGNELIQAFPFLSEKILKEYRQVFDSGKRMITEEKTIVGGQEIFTETIKIPIIELDEVTQIITIIRNITDKKRTQDELLESHDIFQVLTEQTMLGIVILQDDIIKYANTTAGTISGFSKEEIIGFKSDQFWELIHPEDRKFVMEQAQKKQTGDINDVVTHYQCRITLKSGKSKLIELFSKTINYQGRSADFITMMDITDRKVEEN